MSEDKIIPNTGRVVVKPNPATREMDGFIVPEKNAEWGEVVAIGPPMNDMYSSLDMTKWVTKGIHPSPFNVGDMVLMPSIGGRDADELKVFWQHDIPCWKLKQ